jgi:hypothetical protein
MSNVIPLRAELRKPPASKPENREAQPVTIQLELSAALADRIKVAAGYACKSPGQWTRDALTAILISLRVNRGVVRVADNGSPFNGQGLSEASDKGLSDCADTNHQLEPSLEPVPYGEP